MYSFYNYVILDPTRVGRYSYPELDVCFLYEPFYIGKGKFDRKYQHLQESSLKRNNLRNNRIKHILKTIPNKSIIRDYIIEFNSNISELDAFATEVKYISVIGRKDIGTGILCNHSAGGEGSSGVYKSEETRAKIREKRKDQVMLPCSDETKRKISEKVSIHSERKKGKTLTEIYGEDKANQILAKKIGVPSKLKGIPRTEEDKEAMRIGKTGKIPTGVIHYRTYPITVTTPDHDVYVYYDGVSTFYKLHKIPKVQMYNMLKDVSYSYKGWLIQKL
jgi:hypothetical protein